MPTLSSTQDDLRALGLLDKRHRELANVSDAWLARKGYTLLSERAVDGTPLVAVALDYPIPCPVDDTADMMIKYWVANLDRKEDLLPAYVKNIVAINAYMESVGVEKVWGAVPKTADHLTSFLDRVAAAGACKKVDGEGVFYLPDLDYANFWFYVGDRKAVTDFMEGK